MPPPTISGEPSMLAPVPFTPLTVSNCLLVSNCQRTLPSAVEYARMPPSSEPAITAPGTAVAAPPCEALQRGCPSHKRGDGGGALHTGSPVASLNAFT